jgi:hypothetical protein
MPLEKDNVNKIMKGRGYTSVSHNETGGEVTNINYLKMVVEGQLSLHAKVNLKKECISLYVPGLKYFCQISAENFQFDHPDFAKYEQIMTMYGAKCMELDVFGMLDSLKKVEGVNDGVTEGVKEKKTLAIRKREFWDTIVEIGKKRNYPKDSCKAFYDYWTQANEGGVKMQFEIMKVRKGVFDIGGRLATWMKNDKNWASANKNFVEKKADQQNKEAQKTTVIDKSKLF